MHPAQPETADRTSLASPARPPPPIHRQPSSIGRTPTLQAPGVSDLEKPLIPPSLSSRSVSQSPRLLPSLLAAAQAQGSPPRPDHPRRTATAPHRRSDPAGWLLTAPPRERRSDQPLGHSLRGAGGRREALHPGHRAVSSSQEGSRARSWSRLQLPASSHTRPPARPRPSCCKPPRLTRKLPLSPPGTCGAEASHLRPRAARPRRRHLPPSERNPQPHAAPAHSAALSPGAAATRGMPRPSFPGRPGRAHLGMAPPGTAGERAAIASAPRCPARPCWRGPVAAVRGRPAPGGGQTAPRRGPHAGQLPRRAQPDTLLARPAGDAPAMAAGKSRRDAMRPDVVKSPRRFEIQREEPM